MCFKIRHDGCTTSLTRECEELMISMQHCQPFKDRGYNWVVIEVRGRNKHHISGYLSHLKRHRNVRSVLEMKRINSGNSLRLSLIETYEGMISSLAYEMGAIQKMEVAKNGEEFWNVIIPVVNKNSFLELLPLYGEVIDMQSKESDFTSVGSIFLSLTHQESFVLKTAYEMGFFAYPKKVHLKDVAMRTNLSISTVNEYIRISQKKLLAYFMDATTIF